MKREGLSASIKELKKLGKDPLLLAVIVILIASLSLFIVYPLVKV